MRRTTPVIAILTVGACVFTACGSDGKDAGRSGSGTSGTGAKTVSTACSLATPPPSSAKAPATTTSTIKASGKVGVILPDTTSSPRYTQYDAPLLTSALKSAGATPLVQNAGGDVSKFKSIAQQMIGNGIKVLIMDSIDPSSGAAVEQLASQAGVQVIDYDRVNLGGTAPYYVAFDAQDLGRQQAQGLVDCLDADGVTKPKIIMMDGGTDVDNNATLLAKGSHEVLDPLVKAGKLTIAAEAVVKGWDVNNAAPTFTQTLTKTGAVDGVLAANDDIGNAVATVLKKNGAEGKLTITGQDATIAGLQSVITGTISTTLFKDIKKYEAPAAAQLAIALLAGKDPSAAGLTLSTSFKDPRSPNRTIKTLLLPSTVITQANVQDVLDAGAVTKSDLCKGITEACTKIGLK